MLSPPGPGADRPCVGELLGTLAHELRDPLVTIVRAAQVITNAYDVGPPVRRAIAVMERQSRHRPQRRRGIAFVFPRRAATATEA